MRPKSLAEVATIAAGGESFDFALADFLDEFYGAPDFEALAQEPMFLAPKFGRVGQVEDAYLAATAQELARRFKLPIPEWVPSEDRKLRRPWFASDLAGLRAVLIHESPASFRERNLFVSANALSRV